MILMLIARWVILLFSTLTELWERSTTKGNDLLSDNSCDDNLLCGSKSLEAGEIT